MISSILPSFSSSFSAAGDGVHGLRKLGCKEMTYKILFLCSSIQHTDQRAGLVVRDASVHSSFVIPTRCVLYLCDLFCEMCVILCLLLVA